MTKEIKGRDCLKIRKTSITKNYRDDSKMKGQQYHIFSYGEFAFAVNTNDDFVKAFAEGQVFSAEFAVSDEGWSLTGFSTIQQETAMAKALGQIAQYEKGVFDLASVKPEDIIA